MPHPVIFVTPRGSSFISPLYLLTSLTIFSENMNQSNATTDFSVNISSASAGGIHLQYDAIQSDDATWILTSAFIIFTMQSGFGLLEAGMVSKKNESNIMVKNAVDVIYGGFAYWLFGFGFSFGRDVGATAFNGFGKFFTDAENDEMGDVFAKYFFHLSFSTTATTIVSGAMAERVELKAYILFSFVNTLTYCFPAHWIWEPKRLALQDGCYRRCRVRAGSCGRRFQWFGSHAISTTSLGKV